MAKELNVPIIALSQLCLLYTSALNNTGKILLKDHIEHCLVEAVENGDMASIDRLNKAIELFLK